MKGLIKKIVGALTPTKKRKYSEFYVWPSLPDEIAKQFNVGKYSIK